MIFCIEEKNNPLQRTLLCIPLPQGSPAYNISGKGKKGTGTK